MQAFEAVSGIADVAVHVADMPSSIVNLTGDDKKMLLGCQAGTSSMVLACATQGSNSTACKKLSNDEVISHVPSVAMTLVDSVSFLEMR